MNTVIENLLTRRSCRSFTDTPIPRETLEEILKTAVYAPSGMGLQTWQFTAITDPAKIQDLACLIGAQLGREGYDFYSPQVLIITSNERDSRFGREDNACALENIFLAAHSCGIGSVWINQMQGISDIAPIRAKLSEFAVPDSHIVFGMAALGYPAGELSREVKKKGIIKIVD